MFNILCYYERDISEAIENLKLKILLLYESYIFNNIYIFFELVNTVTLLLV